MDNTPSKAAAPRRKHTIPFDELPDSALIRTSLLDNIVPFGRVTLWRQVKAGKFPAPVELNDVRAKAFRVGEVRAWLAAQGRSAR